MTPNGKRCIALAEAPGGEPVLRAYQDTKGIWTIGIGRNLQTLRITRAEALAMFDRDVEAAEILARSLPSWPYMNTADRQDAFIELVFNMGPAHFDGQGSDDFKNFMHAAACGDWRRAAMELLDSKWAKDVGPTRSRRIATTIELGHAALAS